MACLLKACELHRVARCCLELAHGDVELEAVLILQPHQPQEASRVWGRENDAVHTPSWRLVVDTLGCPGQGPPHPCCPVLLLVHKVHDQHAQGAGLGLHAHRVYGCTRQNERSGCWWAHLARFHCSPSPRHRLPCQGPGPCHCAGTGALPVRNPPLQPTCHQPALHAQGGRAPQTLGTFSPYSSTLTLTSSPRVS